MHTYSAKHNPFQKSGANVYGIGRRDAMWGSCFHDSIPFLVVGS